MSVSEPLATLRQTVREGETLYPVIRAVELATGRRPHKSAVYRWMGSGRHGHRLPWLALGAIRHTSVEAVRRWMAAVTAEADHAAETHRQSRPHF